MSRATEVRHRTRASQLWRACRNVLALLGFSLGLAANAANQADRVAESAASTKPIEILLAGNSIVYFNNLPAHLEAFARAAGGPGVRVTMLAGPGHRITQHGAAGIVATALRQQHFDWLILQDFGRGWLCGPNQAALEFECAESLKAHQQLAHAARQANTRVVILGTYSFDETDGKSLANNERNLAQALDAKVVSLESFPACRKAWPDYRWVAPDGGHPGPDLTAMMALRLLDTIGHPITTNGVIQIEAHAFDLKRSPRANLPYHTTNPLPLTPTDRWVYAPQRLRVLATCDPEAAKAQSDHCGNQVACIGRDPIWRLDWVGHWRDHQ